MPRGSASRFVGWSNFDRLWSIKARFIELLTLHNLLFRSQPLLTSVSRAGFLGANLPLHQITMSDSEEYITVSSADILWLWIASLIHPCVILLPLLSPILYPCLVHDHDLSHRQPGDIVAIRHGIKGRQEGLVIGSHFDYAVRPPLSSSFNSSK
jgi:hypothetical protein